MLPIVFILDSTAISANLSAIAEGTLQRLQRTMTVLAPEAASWIRNRIQQSGAVDGAPKYLAVPVAWLRKRKTYPFPNAQNDGERSANLQYIKTAKPLIDTGEGVKSITPRIRFTSTSAGFSVHVAPYMWKQHTGVPGKVRKRPFMEWLPGMTEKILERIRTAVYG